MLGEETRGARRPPRSLPRPRPSLAAAAASFPHTILAAPRAASAADAEAVMRGPPTSPAFAPPGAALGALVAATASALLDITADDVEAAEEAVLAAAGDEAAVAAVLAAAAGVRPADAAALLRAAPLPRLAEGGADVVAREGVVVREAAKAVAAWMAGAA